LRFSPRNVVVTSVADCVSACCDDTNCEAWTFTSNQTETLMNCPVNGPCCWLKSVSSQKPNPNPLTTSGIVSRWSFSWNVDIYVDHSVVEVRRGHSRVLRWLIVVMGIVGGCLCGPGVCKQRCRGCDVTCVSYPRQRNSCSSQRCERGC
jgi:PAN domain